MFRKQDSPVLNPKPQTLTQDPPAPRHSHTAVWDGSDSLIVFGGVSAAATPLADLRVLSLSTGYWSSPQTTGGSLTCPH